MKKYDKIYFSGIQHRVVKVYEQGSISLVKVMCEDTEVDTDVPSYILQLANGTGIFIDGCDLLSLSEIFSASAPTSSKTVRSYFYTFSFIFYGIFSSTNDTLSR